MKTRKLTLALASFMLVSAAFVSSCKKKTTETTDNNTTAAADNNLAETTSNDIISMTGQASENGSLSSYRLGGGEDVSGISCATYSVTGTQAFTLTFNGGTCLDGRTRSGTLMFDWSGSTNGATHYRNPGFKCVVTSSGYVVDGNAITVNKTITNTTQSGFNPATTNLTWLISSSITIVKANSGGTVNWNCPARTKTLLNTSDTVNCYHGQSTPITWSQAKIGIMGNANCTSSTGESFAVNVTSQLVRDFGGCHINGRVPFIQGAFNFTPGSKATRYVDYGSGTCDLTYTVTINNTTYTLTLP